jgi:predicted phosphodiesterase
MKIQVISDLHREFGFMDLSFHNADVVILAGDVDLGTKGIDWIKSAITDVPVIYVLGNHEYYKGSYPKTLNAIRNSASDTNVHVLENKSVTIDDVTFHGATLWTDFALMGDSRINGSICQEKMNDYKMIRRDPAYSKLRSIDTYVMHQQSLKWLHSSLESSEHFKTNILSSAYASNRESMISQYQPQYWIHGHIHTPTNYQVGETKVICNPHGYMNEPYNGYEKELMIEI